MKKVIDRSSAISVRDMCAALNDMLLLGYDSNRSRVGLDPDTTYITLNSDSVRLALVEETLTDGSKVYNVELTEASR